MKCCCTWLVLFYSYAATWRGSVVVVQSFAPLISNSVWKNHQVASPDGGGSTFTFTATSSTPKTILQACFSEPPSVVFRKLAASYKQLDTKQLVEKWTELGWLVEDGDLGQDELEELMQANVNGNGKLDATGFANLYDTIENLFVEDEEDASSEPIEEPQPAAATELQPPPPPPQVPLQEEPTTIITPDNSGTALEQELLSLLAGFNTDDDVRVPYGLDCNDKERDQVSQLVHYLQTKSNLVVSKGGQIPTHDLMGKWELLYTSSPSMSINKSLSGLGRSASVTYKYGGLIQELSGTK
jgi:hypothetical protein